MKKILIIGGFCSLLLFFMNYMSYLGWDDPANNSYEEVPYLLKAYFGGNLTMPDNLKATDPVYAKMLGLDNRGDVEFYYENDSVFLIANPSLVSFSQKVVPVEELGFVDKTLGSPMLIGRFKNIVDTCEFIEYSTIPGDTSLLDSLIPLVNSLTCEFWNKKDPSIEFMDCRGCRGIGSFGDVAIYGVIDNGELHFLEIREAGDPSKKVEMTPCVKQYQQYLSDGLLESDLLAKITLGYFTTTTHSTLANLTRCEEIFN